MSKRKRRRKPIVWRFVRKTKGGRVVQETTLVPWSSAKSGLSKWFVRFHVSSKIARLDPKKYSYTFFIDFRFQFPGKRTIVGTLEVVPDPRHWGRKKPETFLGTKPFRRGLNIPTWLLYREVVRSLMLGNRGELPTYAKKIGRKKGFRRYRKFELRLRVERIRRDLPKARKKRRRK